MPIFDFHCTNCSKDFDELVRGSEKVSCPECKSRKVERKLSPFAIRFKGSGFHNTDYKAKADNSG